MMEPTPVQIACALNHIASKIERSSKPSVSAVKRDIDSVITAMGWEEKRRSECRKIASRVLRLALMDTGAVDKAVLEELEGMAGGQERKQESDEKLSKLLWDTDEGRDVEQTYGDAHKQSEDEMLTTALKRLKKDIDEFIVDLSGKESGKGKAKREMKEDEESGDVVTSAPPK